MTVKEYLQGYSPEQYHIFDSHQEAMEDRGMVHADQDYERYCYDIHKNNKPKAGDAFLYRRPGKSSKTRKFYIYGGGIIECIVPVDRAGNVEALIIKPFKLKEPLVQGETKRLEDFEWTSKQKTPGSWGHFWNQYGMNVIDEHDFFGLIGECECTVPLNNDVFPPNSVEFAFENSTTVKELEPTGYIISVIDNDSIEQKMPITTGNHTLTGKKIDFEELNHSKCTLGKAGELIVIEYLREQLDGKKYRIEHTSLYEGDGFGYDIKVTSDTGEETYIEVKTTMSKYVDGFYISPRELNASRALKNYQIYRVYNFNPEKRTADIKIYDVPFKEETFRFAAVGWKVFTR